MKPIALRVRVVQPLQTDGFPRGTTGMLSYHRMTRVPKDPAAWIVGRFMAGSAAVVVAAVAGTIVRCQVLGRHVDVANALSLGAAHAATMTLAGGLLLGAVLYLRDRATGPWGVDRRWLWSVAAGAAYGTAYVAVYAYLQVRRGAPPPYLPEPFTSLQYVLRVLGVPALAAFWLRPPPRYGLDH